MSPAATKPAKTPISGKKDYGYSNARLRGMRSHLLRSDALERLIDAPDMQSLIQELMQTQYASDLEEVLIQGRGAEQIAEALRRHVVRIDRKVFGFLNGEAKHICSTLLGRYDVFNLKTILRGKHVRLETGEIAEGLLPVGELTQVDLDGLLVQNDIRGVVDTATTWNLVSAAAMREGFGEYQRSGEIADLELALDHFYAEWASKRLARRNRNYAMGRRIISMQVDIQNLIMVFRAARENLQPEQSELYFLRGGADVSLETYQQLAALSDVDEVLDGLRGGHFGNVLEEAALHYLETSSIASFERALEDYFTRKVIVLGSTDPLGAGIPIAYIFGKMNEATNIRIITKAKEIGIPPERTRRELILV